MDDSDLAIEQALQRLDSESSDSEVNLGEPGSESCSVNVVDSTDLQMRDGMFPIMRCYVVDGRKLNSLQNSATATNDNSSVASFSTDSDAGAKSDMYCHQPRPAAKSSRMTVSDTEGPRHRKSHRAYGGAYLTESKYVSREEFALQLRERLYAVAKDRDTMTMKARDLLRQRGLSYEEIMSAQWYDLEEACKYLKTVDLPSGSQSGDCLQPPSSHHQLSPLEVHSPGPTGMPGLRQGSLNGMRDVDEAMREWHVSNQANRKRHPHRQTNSGCSSVFSATSDSGVGGDTWASSELTTPTNDDRLRQYLQRQNHMAARQPERERMATSAAIALISNSPHPESLSPLPLQYHQHDNERQRRHIGQHYSSGDDSSSAFTITSQSSTSDLFIPKRPPHMVTDTEDQQHYHNNMHYIPRRPLSTPKRSNMKRAGHTPSPLTEQHRQQIPSQQSQRPKGDSHTLIIYTLDELPTPFAKRLGGTDITLKDFKERVFARPGEYRFFFKSFCPDVKMELLEEYSDDEAVLPLVQGKIEGRVEKISLH